MVELWNPMVTFPACPTRLAPLRLNASTTMYAVGGAYGLFVCRVQVIPTSCALWLWYVSLKWYVPGVFGAVNEFHIVIVPFGSNGWSVKCVPFPNVP